MSDDLTLKQVITAVWELSHKVDDGFQNLSEKMSALKSDTEKRFTQIDERLNRMDRHFEQIDSRLEQIDARFEQIELSLRQMDKRQEELNAAQKNANNVVAKLFMEHELDINKIKDKIKFEY
ncbi:hypothetical protein QS257_06380 [Terrilactibacillus sp. S3-3]|nr:hypothetical protein QS257_06380 [Terrilactibacillus sp. S3-3]